MTGSFSHSRTRRFFKTQGMALVRAFLVGSALGPLAYYRPAHPGPQPDREERQPAYLWLVDQLESLERQAFDWRMRELGERSQRSESVVLVTVDDETLENARRSDLTEIAVQPWPRALLGGLVQELMAEGAAQVVVDLPLSDDSPHPPPKVGGPSDDESFRNLLALSPKQVALGFDFGLSPPPPLSLPLTPWRVRVGHAPVLPSALDLVQKVIADRRPAYLFPSAEGYGVWAGIAAEEEAESLSKKWRPGKAVELRDLIAIDRSQQVGPAELLLMRGEVEVEGLSKDGIFQARSLRTPASPLMDEGIGLGAARPARDSDGFVRSVSQLIAYASLDGKTHLLPSLPLVAAMQWAKSDQLSYRSGRLWVGEKLSLPMDPAGFSLLRFDAAEASFEPKGSLKRAVSAWRVLVNYLDRRRGAMLHYDHALKGRVVVLSQTASERVGILRTPIGELRGHGAVLGQAISNWISSQGIVRATPKEDAVATFALAAAGALLALTFGRLFRSVFGAAAYLLLGAAVAVGYGLYAREVFLAEGKWIAVVGPLLAAGASFVLTSIYALRSQQEVKEFITGVLGRYVSPEVARQVTRDLSLVRPERRPLTILFADLHHFTAQAEQLAPADVSDLLHDFFTAATDVIRQSNGQVDKFLGDGLMAFWGAPIRSSKHAKAACEAALRLLELVERKQADWEKKLRQKLVLRVGLNTGEVVVGDLGSFHKPTYTAVGAAVNWATALEKLNSQLGTSLLVGEGTVREAGDGFVFREVASQAPSEGHPHAKVFELVCFKKELTDAKAQRLAQFAQGYLCFAAQDYAPAAAAFGPLSSSDPVAAAYLSECYRQIPLSARQDRGATG